MPTCRDITGLPTHVVARRGLIHVPEGRKLFPSLTVAENLEVGSYARGGPDRRTLAQVLDLLPVLRERIGQRAGTLSGGEQQMLALGRALMARPVLLMLDEPSLGLAPIVARQVLEAVNRIRHELGLTVLLVEQNVRLALPLADRGFVLEHGELARTGDARMLLADAEGQRRYVLSQLRAGAR